ncbi:spore cortex-lytic enzyme [Alkalibacillus almallahensis]|uniref:spore cortex-lytic enzyme n=1 Tax=Alkalibacillus almallahensis TaxID=1379154 RepID=UPI003C7C2958|nr:N-acetylmuramoyl-L-alanine amidase [Alkalibacillus almallahensis]
MMKQLLGIIIICLVILGTNMTVSGFSDQVIQKGATGDDVIELQARLQYNGYYEGQIDGVFGWGTYWSVRNFQEAFGLESVDGLVGDKTKQKLVNATEYDERYIKQQINNNRDVNYEGGKQPDQQTNEPTQESQESQNNQDAATNEPQAVNVPSGFSQNDINLMARAVYAEGRGEPYNGQVAIAAVIINRLDHPDFPDSISGIIYEPLAFEAVADGQINMQPNAEAREAVMDATNGWDPSGGAIYYFNPETATSDWIWSRPQIKRIGKHIFMK